MASHLHMTLDDVKSKTTHRQFLCWMRYLSDEWNRPNRSDHYAMQIAYEVCRANVKHPAKVKQKHFKMEFDTESAVEKKRKLRNPMTRREAAAISQSKWFSATGFKKDK